jgi:hypothetical protein
MSGRWPHVDICRASAVGRHVLPDQAYGWLFRRPVMHHDMNCRPFGSTTSTQWTPKSGHQSASRSPGEPGRRSGSWKSHPARTVTGSAHYRPFAMPPPHQSLTPAPRPPTSSPAPPSPSSREGPSPIPYRHSARDHPPRGPPRRHRRRGTLRRGAGGADQVGDHPR